MALLFFRARRSSVRIIAITGVMPLPPTRKSIG